VRFRLNVIESNRPLLTGGHYSELVVKAGLTVIKKLIAAKHNLDFIWHRWIITREHFLNSATNSDVFVKVIYLIFVL